MMDTTTDESTSESGTAAPDPEPVPAEADDPDEPEVSSLSLSRSGNQTVAVDVSQPALRTVRDGLSTFRGVFRPTVLTLLGVMMYLRLGWVVGEAGLLGTLAIILLTFGITVPTALSLSSITTNIRLGHGGAFGLIAQALGLETGGAIGIPLYVAQALSAALFLYGFTETWTHIFPTHPSWLVLGVAFLIVSLTVSFSQALTIRLQGAVFWLGVAALLSILLGIPVFHQTASVAEFQSPQWWGGFPGEDFWHVFAVFFPAGTGIMVGAGMSGALRNPRRSIPRGTLLAVGTALAVYVLLAVWYGVMASPEELRGNYMIVVERAAWGPVVLAGILGSTFTAALNSMMTAPRVLQSMGAYGVLPRSELFADNLRNASLLTSGLVGFALMLGSLDRVAILITMFFLLTYLVVNVVVLVEQSLGLVSFRPTFRVPIWVPLFGAVGASMASFIVGPAFAMVAITIVGAVYIWLVNRHLETPWETVRSSVFVSLVDWASRQVSFDEQDHAERSWKPDILVPVTTRAQLDGSFRFLCALVAPKGSLQVIGVAPTHEMRARHLDELSEAIVGFRAENLYATATLLESEHLVRGVRQCCAVLAGSHFRPNVLYALVRRHSQETLQGLVDASIDFEIGAAFLEIHPEAGFGHEHAINVWVRDQGPNWQLGLRLANLDLSILFGYQVGRNWNAEIRMVTVVADVAEVPKATEYLLQLIEDARLPSGTTARVMVGDFETSIGEAPHADLQIMGLANTIDKDRLEAWMERAGSSVLFVRDSGRESALA